MELKDKIKELRVKNCLTQEQLAEKLHVSRQTISKYELGVNEPDISTLKSMCTIFDCEIGDLIELDNKKIKDKKIDLAIKNLYIAILSVISFGILSTMIFLRFLPNEIALHFDINGAVDNVGSKYFLLALDLIYLLPLFLILIYQFSAMRVKEMHNKKVQLSILITILVVEVLYLVINYIVSCINLINVEAILMNLITALTSGAVLVLGLSMISVLRRRNMWFGFRTIYSMKNDENWYKLNLFQVVCGSILSLTSIILSLVIISEYSFLFMFLIIGSVFITLLYQIYLQIIDKKNK